jgi:hypothetical protein
MFEFTKKFAHEHYLEEVQWFMGWPCYASEDEAKEIVFLDPYHQSDFENYKSFDDFINTFIPECSHCCKHLNIKHAIGIGDVCQDCGSDGPFDA